MCIIRTLLAAKHKNPIQMILRITERKSQGEKRKGGRRKRNKKEIS